MEPSGSNINKFPIFFQRKVFFYISGKGSPEKIPYISGNKNPKKLLIFQEVTF